jgi:hypothetical protein
MSDKTEDDAIIVHDADTKLREKAGGAGALGKLFSADRISKGQKVIEEFKLNFFGEMNAHLHVLRKACDGPVDINEVKATAKALKSQAETLGFDFLYALSSALYLYLSDRKVDLSASEILVVQKHAEAIILAIEHQERGKGGVKEAELLQSLTLLRKKFP